MLFTVGIATGYETILFNIYQRNEYLVRFDVSWFNVIDNKWFVIISI